MAKRRDILEARRHGWLHDFEYALDQGPNGARMQDIVPRVEQPAQPPASPVTVNININLGDIVDKLVGQKKSTKEALQEIVERKSNVVNKEKSKGKSTKQRLED